MILVGKEVKKRLYSRYQQMYFEFGSQFSSEKKNTMALSHHHGASTGTVRRQVSSAGGSHQPTVPQALIMIKESAKHVSKINRRSLLLDLHYSMLLYKMNRKST